MMKTNTLSTPPAKQDGIALLEALIAILVFSIGILGVVALQSNMIQATGDAKFRAEASFIAQQRVGQIWAGGDSAAALANQGVVGEVVPGLPGGLISVVRGCQGSAWCFTVTVSWVQPGTGVTHNVTTESFATPTIRF